MAPPSALPGAWKRDWATRHEPAPELGAHGRATPGFRQLPWKRSDTARRLKLHSVGEGPML